MSSQLFSENFGVLWVNSPPENLSQKLTKRLWNEGVFRACTDGAANFIMPLVQNEHYLTPNLISGDFDSITTKARNFFDSQAEFVETSDPDYTDMTKSLKIIAGRINNKKLDMSKLIILGGLCGRFDHVLSSLHSLLQFSACDAMIIDGYNLLTILPKGSTHLNLTGRNAFSTGMCGVIPFVQEKTMASTVGLKWNLHNTELAFGKLISSSNEVVCDRITITTTAPVVFTAELKQGVM
ncbi:unnamed protein product [Thelazia callipaeda]|uniref:Thiamine diphosphokinase n=1 Tax=Thelazia callipaeda TaxID=103827 RepID=A0A0N5CN35_THECL|nr:unnamed protein product [Thelazia callipaeda]